ncbi:MAG: SusC/RagA family TonB-linked outer membrane protein, partial [Bacteroidales bacterium]
RYTYDILAQRLKVIPGTYGAGLSAENYGEMDVRGFEILLNYRNNLGAFKYSLGGNIGYSKDKVIYVDEPEGLEDWRSAIGQPLDRIWGFKDYGLIKDEATLNAIPDDYKVFGREPMLGTIYFQDIRGQNRSPEPDGIIDFNDQTWLSTNGIPRINYGINLGFEWNNISTSFLFQGVGAYDKMVTTTHCPGVFQTGDKPYFDLWTEAWTPEKPNNPYPRAGNWGYAELGYESTEFWKRNGAYLRLKDLRVAYTIPGDLTKKILMDKAQVYFNGTNLFFLSDFKEYDPEQAYLNSFNLMKTFTFGLSINF